MKAEGKLPGGGEGDPVRLHSPEPLDLDLGENRGYRLWFGLAAEEALLDFVRQAYASDRQLVVITDETVQMDAHQGRRLKDLFGEVPVYAIPSGEASKSVAQLESLWERLAADRITRKACLVAFGGGVVGDLAGFVAASYLRGIDFIQVPTTLLAMVDSSVGGKTGINLRAGKNLVGAFHQPRAVYAITDTLRTLTPREFGAGMAEVIKHGLLADAALFERLEGEELLHREHPEMAALVRWNCRIKAAVVAADETEQAIRGGRMLLNLGHTFGHALEKVAGYGAYLHGEAVGLGLVLASRLSAELFPNQIKGAELERIERVVQRYGLPVRLREPVGHDALWEAMTRDKKQSSEGLRFVVLEEIGRAVTTTRVSKEQVLALWKSVGAV